MMKGDVDTTPYEPITGPQIKRLKRIKSATILLLILNIALVLTIVVFIAAIRVKFSAKLDRERCKTEKIEDNNWRRYCFTLNERECLDRGYVFTVKNNDSVCCGNFDEHVYSVMSEKIADNLRADFSRGRVLDTVKSHIRQLQRDPRAMVERATAHVGILPTNDTTGPDNTAPRIQWAYTGEETLVTGGILHGGDRLTVTKPGYYYVYAGLQYDVNPRDKYYGAIVAYLYRHVNGTRASQHKLMTSRESSCQMTRNDVTGPVSMYMAGIFMLRDRDEISVITASQSLLHRSPATTYLGMHMV